MNGTLQQIEKCSVQCETAPQLLPEDRGVDSVGGAFEKAAGKEKKKKQRPKTSKVTF